MGLQQVAALARERQAVLVVAQVHHLDETLVAQVFARATVDVEVVLRYDSKGADSGQRAAVVAVQLVHVVADHDQLALLAARQVEVAHETLTRVIVAVPFVVHALAAAFPSLTVARVISRIEHGCPPEWRCVGCFVKAPGRLPRGRVRKALSVRGGAPRRVQGVVCRNPARVRWGHRAMNSARLFSYRASSRPQLLQAL